MLAFSLILVLSQERIYGSRRTQDHLVPLDWIDVEKHGPVAAYRRLYEKKLFITPADVIRYVHLPGASRTEVALSVYTRGERSGKRGEYWLTVTQASGRLWDCIAKGGKRPLLDVRTITVNRYDASLPAPTAVAVRDVYLTMLKQIAPDPCPECIGIDRSTEIFSVTDSSGVTLRGQLPMEVEKNTQELLELTNRLLDYCLISVERRSQTARLIENKAKQLRKKVQGKDH